MYTVTVIPIAKGSQKEYLTYFSATDIPLGCIVVVPLRSKSIDAIVVALEDVRTMKSDIKSADFQLKKIIEVKGNSPFSSEFFVACERMKDYTASTTGSIIRALLPQVYLQNSAELKTYPKTQDTVVEESETEHPATPPAQAYNNTLHEKLIFQAVEGDRMSFYRTQIRESFAKKESLFICLPTLYDIERFRETLARGIEQYVYIFHGDLSKKKLITFYNACIEEPHPILIIGTGMFLSIPRTDIQTIIVEHESSDAYKQFTRPYVDIRSFVEVLTAVRKIKLIYGDTLLRVDTFHRHELGELGEIAPPLFRLPQAERQIVVDMKEELTEKGLKKFTLLADTTKKMIEYALAHDEHVFLYTVRKGLAPFTVCHDCGHTLTCPFCSTPVVLYGSKSKNGTEQIQTRIFMCNKCGKKETTHVRCPECQSWNLTPLGIGADRVYNEIHTLFPHTPIFQIDKENTQTDKQARTITAAYTKTKGSILIGTELAFSYLTTPVTHGAIVSLDGLLSIPSFNMTQKVLHTIEKLHSLVTRNLIIQTRIPDNTILQNILSGNVLPLVRSDLLEREQYGYPPYKRLIKITHTGTKEENERARLYLEQILGNFEPQIFSAFIGRVKGQYVTNTVIKIDPRHWQLPLSANSHIDRELLSILHELPPSYAINVDPDDLL